MTTTNLAQTAAALVAPGKGILAIDESNGTSDTRFKELGIPTGPETRRAYREMLLTVPGLSAFVSGAILYDETIRQSDAGGVPFLEVMRERGILPGIKVDTGTEALPGFPNEKLTHGLDGLRKRVAEYATMGARFAKWRAVLRIGADMPSPACVAANAQALALYAALCQEGGLVPIVEPEILMDGDHSLERAYAASVAVWRVVFEQLALQNVALDGIILKPGMIIEGVDAPVRSSVGAVARATVSGLRQAVPAAVAGIAFLSGGQSNELASAHLQAMHEIAGSVQPWPLTFSYGRALQQPALHAWAGKPENVAAAQAALYHRARCNGAAAQGRYSEPMEKEKQHAAA